MNFWLTQWLTQHRFAGRVMGGQIRHQPMSVVLNILVVGIALALPLLGFTVLKNLQPIASQLANAPEVSVFMNPSASRADAEALATRLQAMDAIAKSTFVPREQALTQLKNQANLDPVVDALNRNPLPDAWILQLSPKLSATEQDALVASLKVLPKVDQVRLDSAWVRRIEALLRFLRWAVTLLAAALASAVVAVVFNTIRLQVLTQRDEIELSQLIGATHRFIRRPFYYFGLLLGVGGGLLALALVFFALIPLNQALQEFSKLYAWNFSFRPLGGMDSLLFLLGAAFLGWLGAILSASRHLWRKT